MEHLETTALSFCVKRHSRCPQHRQGTFILNENNKYIQVSPRQPDAGTLVQMFRQRLLVRAEGQQRQMHRDTPTLLAFTTPKQFLQPVWPKMLSVENGFADRALLFYQRKEEKDLEFMAQHSVALEEFPIQSLDGVLECWSVGGNLC